MADEKYASKFKVDGEDYNIKDAYLWNLLNGGLGEDTKPTEATIKGLFGTGFITTDNIGDYVSIDTSNFVTDSQLKSLQNQIYSLNEQINSMVQSDVSGELKNINQITYLRLPVIPNGIPDLERIGVYDYTETSESGNSKTNIRTFSNYKISTSYYLMGEIAYKIYKDKNGSNDSLFDNPFKYYDYYYPVSKYNSIGIVDRDTSEDKIYEYSSGKANEITDYSKYPMSSLTDMDKALYYYNYYLNIKPEVEEMYATVAESDKPYLFWNMLSKEPSDLLIKEILAAQYIQKWYNNLPDNSSGTEESKESVQSSIESNRSGKQNFPSYTIYGYYYSRGHSINQSNYDSVRNGRTNQQIYWDFRCSSDGTYGSDKSVYCAIEDDSEISKAGVVDYDTNEAIDREPSINGSKWYLNMNLLDDYLKLCYWNSIKNSNDIKNNFTLQSEFKTYEKNYKKRKSNGVCINFNKIVPSFVTIYVLPELINGRTNITAASSSYQIVANNNVSHLNDEYSKFDTIDKKKEGSWYYSTYNVNNKTFYFGFNKYLDGENEPDDIKYRLYIFSVVKSIPYALLYRGTQIHDSNKKYEYGTSDNYQYSLSEDETSINYYSGNFKDYGFYNGKELTPMINKYYYGVNYKAVPMIDSTFMDGEKYCFLLYADSSDTTYYSENTSVNSDASGYDQVGTEER